MQTQTMKLRELTIRYAVRKDQDGQPVIVGRALGRPSEAASALMALLQDEPSEVFVILCLTTKFHVIAYHEVGRGTLDTVLVNPREVFKAALLANAAAIVVAHNHPSGDPTPSPTISTSLVGSQRPARCSGSQCSITSSSVTAAPTASRKPA